MKTLLYLLLVALLFPLARFCERETAGFSVMKIAAAQPEKDEARTPPENLFDQKFVFLDRGGQSFAFVSEDGKTVIKFLKRRFSPNFLLQPYLPAFLRQAAQKKQQYVQKKWERDKASYKLAFASLKAESGLIFVHLHTSNNLQKKVTIIDRLGIAHLIDLDTTAFVVQKRATPLLEDLQKEIRTKNIDSAKQTLQKVVNLVCLRCDRGIADEDPRLYKNLGLLEGKPIFIDVGRFKRDETLRKPTALYTDLLRSTAKLKAWLMQEDPALAFYLQELIQDVLD